MHLFNTRIFKLYHVPRGPLFQGTKYNCMQVLQYILCLCKCIDMLLYEYCIIGTMKVYPCDEGMALSNVLIVLLNFY